MELPNADLLRQRIKRVRKLAQTETTSGNMYSMEYELRGACALFGREPFIKEDKTLENGVRYTFFTTDRLLRVLAMAEYFMVDGTFSIVPSFLTQLVTFHGSIKVKNEVHFLPLAFAITNSKCEDLYNNIMQTLKRLTLPFTTGRKGWTPKKAYSDFEIALINSIRCAFPGISVSLCNFHFGQSLWR